MGRGAYILRRLLLLVPTLLAIYTLTFLLIHATPGGPWSQGEKPVPPIVLKHLNEAYGLDKPLWQQYTDYLWNALHGDFGPSFTQRSRSVSDIIGATFPVSFKLGVVAMVIAVVFGLSLGTIGAIRHNTGIDYVTSFVAIVGISTPSYVIVSLLVLLLASTLHLVPTGGWDGLASTKILIPAIALALYPAAVLARYTRASMLEVLSTDYVRTARSKGLREYAVISRHAIRNALLPVITVSGIIFADVITGSFFVESVYSVPGLGRYFVKSITERDYPVILGTVLLFGTVISVMNLIVDILYPLLDPRMER
ncbi:MAG TPA: ABC transporter permease [Thermomicrobiales bacterium]|jgi:oligopeptide transport system permease protein